MKLTHLPDGRHSSKKSSIFVLLTNLDFGLYEVLERIAKYRKQREGRLTFITSNGWVVSVAIVPADAADKP